MSTPTRRVIEAPPGYASREAALFVAQLDDQSRRLTESTRGITPEELEWQPYPGMNTIGMLLAHLAIVEVWWTLIAKEVPDPDVQPVLDFGGDDDGMPIPEGAAPPSNLAGKDIAFYDALLQRARRYVAEQAVTFRDADMERLVERTYRDGTRRTFNLRWIYYHILEHFAGHYGQILLLRHLHQAARVPAKA